MKELKLQLMREFKPKSRNQAAYIRAIAESELVFCVGPAGSGKTAVAVAIGIRALVDRQIDRLVITRPTVETDVEEGGSLGFLPGDIREKMSPYLRPIFDELTTYLSKSVVENLIQDGIIEIAPLQFMRGRTFHDSFVIVDEAQNMSFKQIKMVTTRIGSRSKMIITGDIEQHDRRGSTCALETCINDVIGQDDDIPICYMDDTDIVRSNIVKKMLAKFRIYEDNK